jgi:hypothetical protein
MIDLTLKAWKLIAGGNAPGSLTNMSDPERVAPQEKISLELILV